MSKDELKNMVKALKRVIDVHDRFLDERGHREEYEKWLRENNL